VTSARAEALLDMDVRTMSDDEWGEACKLFPEECDYLLVRHILRPDEPVPFELMDLALELDLRYPHSIDYYRERAEDARWRRLDLKWRARELAERLEASVPFKISAGARK
jgi:hypothetical protein